MAPSSEAIPATQRGQSGQLTYQFWAANSRIPNTTRLDALTPAAVTCSILALRGRTVDDNPHSPVLRARPLDFRVCGRCRRRHPAPAPRDEGLAAARAALLRGHAAAVLSGGRPRATGRARLRSFHPRRRGRPCRGRERRRLLG